MITLNAAVAEALVNFKTRVDALIASGKDKNAAIIEVLREDIKTCKPVRFDGNGYSEEWTKEAARRGLDVERSCPIIFDRYTAPETIHMFESLHIMNRKELAARNDIKWETYTKKVQIEARIFGDLSINHIIPKVVGYQTKLAENVAALKAILPEDQFNQVAQSNLNLISEISQRIKAIEEGCEALTNARKVANKITPIRERAIAYHDTVEPIMQKVRYHIDKLEEKVDDEEWTLPKYREMLFMI
jgi:glutamine synthetase